MGKINNKLDFHEINHILIEIISKIVMLKNLLKIPLNILSINKNNFLQT